MIVLRFGKSGRLARICDVAIRLALPQAMVFFADRQGGFASADDAPVQQRHVCVADFVQACNGQQVCLVDASVDHSSTANLVAHEAAKRALIHDLQSASLLTRAIGFSSGITLVEARRIEAGAAHMLEYRAQKLAQQALFDTLDCPVFIPHIFTLIGPLTWNTQAAAWAQILHARIQRTADLRISEPDLKKAWVSEFRVFRSLVEFLAASRPASVRDALVDGAFTLSEIARTPLMNLPELGFEQGGIPGWLAGDYLPQTLPAHPLPVQDALARALCP